MKKIDHAKPDNFADIIARIPPEAKLSELADVFKVFGDPTRLKIIYALKNSELCVSHLSEAIGAEQSAVSHQLRTLRKAKLVRSRRIGKNIYYSIDDDHVSAILAIALDHSNEKKEAI